MVQVLYADKDILVAVKPAGVESQAAKRFAPDMVSEIRKYLVIHKLCTPGKEPYVGVIHRLDKPVSGVMVYALSKNAAAALSRQVQDRKLEKIYGAVVCGKPEKDVDKFVDYLEKSVDGNESYVVDHGGKCGKRAELSYEALESLEDGGKGILTLLRIRLETTRSGSSLHPGACRSLGTGNTEQERPQQQGPWLSAPCPFPLSIRPQESP